MISPVLSKRAVACIRGDAPATKELVADLFDALNNTQTAANAWEGLAATEPAPVKAPAIHPVEIEDGEVRRVGMES